MAKKKILHEYTVTNRGQFVDSYVFEEGTHIANVQTIANDMRSRNIETAGLTVRRMGVMGNA